MTVLGDVRPRSALKVLSPVPIYRVMADGRKVGNMSDPEAFRTCPFCGTEGVPKLVIYPRLVSGSATSWKCRACDRYWSDAQLAYLRAS